MSTIQFRITDEDKEEAQAILEALGLDLPTAIRMFLKKVKQTKGLPFDVTLEPERDENGLTKEQVKAILQAEKDAEKGINVSPAFDNIEDALAFLDSPERHDD